MKRVLLFGSLFWMVQAVAQAETMGKTAGWFMDYCTSQLHIQATASGQENTVWESMNGSYCAAYLAAAVDSFDQYVIPNGAIMLGGDIKNLHRLTWVYAVFSEYLSRHPELLQGPPCSVIHAALRERIHWTCDEGCRRVEAR